VLLGLVAVLAIFAFRTLSKTNYRRLQKGQTGPETESERSKKRAARLDRKAEEKAQRDGKHGSASKTKDVDDKRKRPRKKEGKQGTKGSTSDIADSKPSAPEPPKDSGLLLPPGKSLEDGLTKTRHEGFVGRLGKLFAGKTIDDSLLDEIESVMFTADIGVRTSEKLLDGLKKGMKSKELSDSAKVWSFLRSEAEEIFQSAGNYVAPDLESGTTPHIVLVIGVNGAGKTTTIGKLAHKAIAAGKQVTIGAGDTFRAAAVDQLEVWAKRVGATIVQGAEGQDPSSVLFDAVKTAQDGGADLVFLDTAGRLHTNKNLIQELKKVKRVIGKAMPGAPHEVLLVLDGTTGQNAIAQAHTFGAELGVTGIVVTKLDGTAKGGVVLGICDELKVPIAWIGIGERTEDLKPFKAKDFISALFG
jgi:fused signal recognition particle receptor